MFAGGLMGRVPGNLENLFRELLSQVTCSSTGNPRISKIAPSYQPYQRNKAGEDRRGGGAIIPCSYSLHYWDENYSLVHSKVTNTVEENGSQGT